MINVVAHPIPQDAEIVGMFEHDRALHLVLAARQFTSLTTELIYGIPVLESPVLTVVHPSGAEPETLGSPDGLLPEDLHADHRTAMSEVKRHHDPCMSGKLPAVQRMTEADIAKYRLRHAGDERRVPDYMQHTPRDL